MDPVVALIAFAVIFPSELPDKTALASLILGTRYSARLVFIGAAAAFTLHVTLAVAAGSLLRLLPHSIVQGIVGAMFLIGAVLLLREGEDAEEIDEVAAEAPEGLSNRKVIATSFFVILVAEFGDLTQIVTANLAAKYHDPIAVGLGAVLALWAVAAVAIVGGQKLLTRVPLKRVTQVAAAIMVVLSALSLIEAFT